METLVKEKARERIKFIRESLWILASSQIMIYKRHTILEFGFPENSVSLFDEQFLFNSLGKDSMHSVSLVSPIEEYKLDNQWKNYVSHHFFFPLLKIVNEERQIDNKWKKSLTQASILAAKSYFNTDLATAFLYDWIAIEMLLLRQGDKVKQVLVDRLHALFGWMSNEDDSDLKEDITSLYKLRNKFIHDGITTKIEVKDLLITDLILYNLLNNLTRLTKIFPNKSAIIDFSEVVAARRRLGLRIKRPNLTYTRPNITEREINRIKLKRDW